MREATNASATLGKCIRDARKAKGIPLTKLGKIIRVSGPTMADFETGRRSLALTQVRTLAAVLEFDVGPLEGLKWMLPRDACRMLGVDDEGLRHLDDRLLPLRQGALSHRRYDYASVRRLADERAAAAEMMARRKKEPRFGWLYVVFARAKRRAQDKGIPFDECCPPLDCPDVCPVLGIPMEYWARKGKHGPGSPTIDRIVPSRGYVAGNLRVISHRANTLKSNATLTEMRLLLADAEHLAGAWGFR